MKYRCDHCKHEIAENVGHLKLEVNERQTFRFCTWTCLKRWATVGIDD